MNRLQGVDVVRALAILAVIIIHTSPFECPSARIGGHLDIATVVNQASRFAVPFFFVISGYFWSCKIAKGNSVFQPTVKMVRRIATIFLFWSVVYLLPVNLVDAFAYGLLGPIKVVYWNLVNLVNNPIRAMFHGTEAHLWFLTSLISSMIISAVFLRYSLGRSLIALAIILYAAGLVGKAYAHTPIGFDVAFDVKEGPFLSLIFFVTGCRLQKKGATGSWFAKGIFLAIIGLMVHFSELLMLHHWGITMDQDCLFGTYFLGVGIALIALSDTKYLRFSHFAVIGPKVLGIYASHYIFVKLLEPIDRQLTGNSLWDVTYVFAVFFLSFLVTLNFAKLPVTRRFVV